MSGTSSTAVVTVAGGGMGEVVGGAGGGGFYYRPPFTAVQWQELEHQAMIYKYLTAGLPVPPQLVVPIRRSFEALSSRFFHPPTLGYCSYYGKKFDPEPGRCRRTDGKKWRCSKDAYPDSKYCERHMHRGRNRSRKPVESHSASQSLSSAMSHMTTGSSSSSSSGIFQSSGTGSFQNMSLYSVGNSEGLYSGNVTKLQIEPASYGSDNKEYRYIHGLTSAADQHNFSPEASGSVGNLGMGSDVGNTWRLLPSQVPSSQLLKSKSDAHMPGYSSDLHMAHAFDPMMDAGLSKQRQQHCFFGSEIASPGSIKQEQHSMRPLFDEWPTSKESWSNLDDAGSNKNAFSTTQLSISIPMAHSEFSSRDSHSTDDG
ncbi:hypothetical protein ACH5RR_039171 [Cinchona calisaya]|uniref:Growth-regulating factor n=1 Tax=Cinchona calisaya TaxID=153742 RepID=A0ABD2XYV6_9GENT